MQVSGTILTEVYMNSAGMIDVSVQCYLKQRLSGGNVPAINSIVSLGGNIPVSNRYL